MITVVPQTKHAWQLVSVDNALKMVTVAEAEPVRMASVSVGKGQELVAVVEMGDQLSISISSRSAALLLEKPFRFNNYLFVSEIHIICFAVRK